MVTAPDAFQLLPPLTVLEKRTSLKREYCRPLALKSTLWLEAPFKTTVVPVDTKAL